MTNTYAPTNTPNTAVMIVKSIRSRTVMYPYKSEWESCRPRIAPRSDWMGCGFREPAYAIGRGRLDTNKKHKDGSYWALWEEPPRSKKGME